MTSEAEPSVASLQYITREELADILKSGSDPTIAIVDVRDSDHIGGHIKNSIHVPSTSLDYALPDLVRRLEDKKTVVFHCMLSQERGPRAALRYTRAIQAKNVGSSRLEQSAFENSKPQQQVYVLQGGFGQWQAKYGEDVNLTEAYHKDLWEE